MSQQINLLNPDLRPRRDWLAFSVVAPLALTALLLVTISAVWERSQQRTLKAIEVEASNKLKVEQERLQALTKAAAVRTGDPSLVAEAERLNAALQLRREALQLMRAGAGSESIGFSAAMGGLARQSMDGLWLTGFAIGRGELEIRGRMLDPSLLPAYIRRLNIEPAFQGRRFSELDMKGIVESQDRPAGQTTVVPVAVPAPRLPAHTEFALRTVGADRLTTSGGRQ